MNPFVVSALAAAWVGIACVAPASADQERAAAGQSSTQGPAAYSGGYFDDGFYDDDWFFDFYDVQPKAAATPSQHNMPPTTTRQEYQADQLYEDARASGLFDS
ncbi:MAG TPA: hypothetical protein VFS39_12620 [Nitrospira sp.]|nr:hypothetical protein [Nitrospira sp.]